MPILNCLKSRNNLVSQAAKQSACTNFLDVELFCQDIHPVSDQIDTIPFRPALHFLLRGKFLAAVTATLHISGMHRELARLAIGTLPELTQNRHTSFFPGGVCTRRVRRCHFKADRRFPERV